MSRTRFWTILIGAEPTSFRARDKDTLVPTLKQLQRRHPEAVIKWFERERLFDSPGDAAAAFARAEMEQRGKDWRPGGDHRDPRARYEITRDEKRRRFKAHRSRDRFDNTREASPRTPARTQGDRPARGEWRGTPRPSPRRPAGPSGSRDVRSVKDPKRRREE
jgi:hypothetical protein